MIGFPPASPRLGRRPLAWALGACLLAAAWPAAQAEGLPGERLTLNFNPAWKFLRSDPGPGTAAPEFDDRAWTSVSAPHTYNDVDSFDHWSVPGHRGEQGTWGGVVWYRKTFAAPAAWRNRRVYIEFEAVRQVAEVYLNGQRLGVCKTGFTPFGFDLTPALRGDGSPNVLAVRCDNRFMKDPLDEDNLALLSTAVNRTIPEAVDQLEANQIPWNNPHWHPAHGGIYRDVRLYVVDPLHISLPLYSFLQTEGPYVYASELAADSAQIHVEVPVQNGRSAAADVAVTAEVSDAAGRLVLALAGRRSVGAGRSSVFQLAGALASPIFWAPDYPYLYRVKLALRVNGRLVDTDEIPCGIRRVRFDAARGFFINGRHLKLHGWGQKPTDEWPGLGAAQPDWLHGYTLGLMQAAGGNWVRWGHSAASPAMIRSGDEWGIMAEQPGVDGESDTVGAAWKLRLIAWRDMLVYFRNHPSIVIWEGGNQHVTEAHVRELRGVLEQIDPHGGRAFAFRRADLTDAKYMDVGIGTEGGREIKQLGVVEGEYDREESPRRVWDNYSPPNFGYPEAADLTQNAYDLTSEQFAVDEVAQYVRKLGAADHSGGANWIFSDTTSGGRVRVEVARASGEVDGERLPKEAYYVCAAMFRSDPQVHLIGHWTYPRGTKKAVYVAANGDDVELFVNGRSLGHGRRSDRFLFTFPAVAWEPGEIKAVAYAHGVPIATDRKLTAGPPVALRLTPLAGPGGFQANGSDVALIDVEAVDARGERCPTVQQRVDFDCDGPAIWRGGYDSGKINSINNPYLDLECGVNRVALRSTLVAGAVTVRARSAGLAAASLTLAVRPFPVADGSSGQLPALWPAPGLAGAPPGFVADPDAVGGPGPAPAPAPAQPGRFIRTFNYTGPTVIAHVESPAEDGKNSYVDRDFAFRGLPAALRGADWVQAAEADALYSAADFMQLAVPAGATVSIAHDDRLVRPAWLLQQFTATEVKLMVAGRPMTIFRRHASGEESLTLGSNTDDPAVKAANMYIVFVQRGSAPAP
jgi:beta-galactosidase